MYCYILVYTGIYWYVPVHTGMNWYIPVCTGTYPVKQKYCICITTGIEPATSSIPTAGLTTTLLAQRVDIGFVETRYIYIVIANGAAWYLLADVGRPAPVLPRRPVRVTSPDSRAARRGAQNGCLESQAAKWRRTAAQHRLQVLGLTGAPAPPSVLSDSASRATRLGRQLGPARPRFTGTPAVDLFGCSCKLE